MRSQIMTSLNLGEEMGWWWVVLLLTLALEVVDVAREWPMHHAPITAEACWESCGWSGLGMQTWSAEQCVCADAGGEP